MSPPAVSASPAPAAKPAPALRARAPFSRPRRERPSLRDPRTLAISLGLHLVAAALVLLAPPVERPAPAPRAPAEGGETVSFLEVGEWGGMATDPGAGLEEAMAAEAVAAAASPDSLLLRPRPAAPGVAFPERVPVGVPRAAGGGAGEGAAAGVGTVPGAGTGDGGGAGGAGRGRSGPGGLGPELGDPRLVVRPEAVEERAPSDMERYQRHFEGAIAAVNDSAAAEAERARRARDWTVGGFGLNERGIVIGGRNVPVPVPNPIPRSARDREDEARRERDQRAEIDRQADGIERDRHIRERQRAIRERADRERQQRRERDP